MPLKIVQNYRTLFIQKDPKQPVDVPTSIVDENLSAVTQSYALSNGEPPPQVVQFQTEETTRVNLLPTTDEDIQQ